MEHLKRFLFGAALSVVLILVGCDSVGPARAGSPGQCDTTVVKFRDYMRTTVTCYDCADTVYIPVVEVDTVYVGPDWDCVKDCLEVNGLGHWRMCLSACIPAGES